jgi:signal transduction histidine kinase/CheY-like chemotaxis protein
MITPGQVWRGEFYNRRKNGEQFWELASIAPVRDAAGRITHHVAVKEDITERKATEERLRLSQRMEVIGQLTGGLAHDFNNLLAIILGNLQLLEEKPELDPETRELIADAIWSAERGAQLTHRLLAFARRQRLNPKATDLNEVVAEMTDLLRRTLGDRIEIREILAQGLWPTMIDRGQLESALLNLVVNARDAMAEGGVLTVATANTTLDDVRTMRTGEVPAGEYVTLTVTDTGIGMAPEILERIFEPFFTTKAFGQGSGLGLSMVYGFVRQTGGHIDVGSEVGLGTTVRLYLPRAYGDEDREPRVQRRPAAAPAGNEVILVVEDDERVRKTTVNVLKRRGYDVVAAGDGREALGALEALARLDLLFTDVVLPNGMNGTQLAQQVMLRRPATRILFTSGYATEAVIGEDLSRQGIDLIPKPYDAVDLAHKVREILDRVA